MQKFDVAIVGAGASGLCAAICAKRAGAGKRIVLFERLGRAGKKILATGNGRCNLSNENAPSHPYHNRAFALEALSRFSVEKTKEFFNSMGLLLSADAAGRLYPLSNTASSVLDSLRLEAEGLGVELFCDIQINSVHRENGGFVLNDSYQSAALIISAGGSASPVHGSNGSGFALLKQLGVGLKGPFPSLVQLVSDRGITAPLKGIRIHDCKISASCGGENASARGEVLFADYGISGIAAMEISRCFSAFFNSGKKGDCFALLDLVPSLEENEIFSFLNEIKNSRPKLKAENLMAGLLPKRAGQQILKSAGIAFERYAGELNESELKALCKRLKCLSIKITGTKGFENAQITAGGAGVEEFSPKTLEHKKIKGLFCCGEILDVDGGCGGFNLQWAWSSGMLAGGEAVK